MHAEGQCQGPDGSGWSMQLGMGSKRLMLPGLSPRRLCDDEVFYWPPPLPAGWHLND
jgi:hypothetical protein